MQEQTRRRSAATLPGLGGLRGARGAAGLPGPGRGAGRSVAEPPAFASRATPSVMWCSGRGFKPGSSVYVQLCSCKVAFDAVLDVKSTLQSYADRISRANAAYPCAGTVKPRQALLGGVNQRYQLPLWGQCLHLTFIFTFKNEFYQFYSVVSTQSGSVTGDEQSTFGSGNHWVLSKAVTSASL